jgi:hypothetical protein
MAPTITLKLPMKHATVLKNVPEVLGELFSTAKFKFSSTGLEVQAMDTSRFSIVVLQLCPKPFDLCICNDDDLSMDLNLRDLSVDLNLADIADAFSFSNNDDIVTMKYQNGGKTVTISLDSQGKFGTRTSFALAALCTDPVLC